jgi:hypothetical protein
MLVSVIHPELRQIDYEGFKYASVQVFEPNKLRIGDHWLTKREFNPAKSEMRNLRSYSVLVAHFSFGYMIYNQQHF